MKIILALFLLCTVLAVYFFVLFCFLIELLTKLFMLLQTKKMVSVKNFA